MTPEQLREIVARIRHAKAGADWEEAGNLIEGYASALEEIERLQMKLKCYEPIHTYDGLDIEQWKERAERAESALAEAERKIERLKALLHSLHSLVWGECPSLLNEDSGGSGHLDADIRAEFKE